MDLLWVGVFVGVTAMLSLALGVALHEFGHALVAWSLGMHVAHVRIGGARVVWRTRVGPFPVEVGARAGRHEPLGMVLAFPLRPGGARWRIAAMLAAGPATNLLLALLPVWFLAWHEPASHVGIALDVCAVIWVLVQGVLFVASALPYRLRRSAISGSDGYQLLRAPWLPQAVLDASTVRGLTLVALGRYSADDVAGTDAYSTRALALDASAIVPRYLAAVVMTRRGRLREAADVLRELIPATDGHPFAGHARADFALLALCVTSGTPAAEVVDSARAALDLSPGDPAFALVYGAVLVRAGQHAEGAARLAAPAPADGQLAWARAMYLCVRANALRELGRLDEAERDVKLASDLDPACPLLPACLPCSMSGDRAAS